MRKALCVVWAETLAIIVAYWTLGWRLRSRPIVHWCDNTGALATVIGGGATFPGASVLTCALHMALLTLQCSVHFEYVNSEANPADWPTRDDKLHRIPSHACWAQLRLPPVFLFRSIMSAETIPLWHQTLAFVFQ